jgi:hypothetical protein
MGPVQGNQQQMGLFRVVGKFVEETVQMPRQPDPSIGDHLQGKPNKLDQHEQLGKTLYRK